MNNGLTSDQLLRTGPWGLFSLSFESTPTTLDELAKTHTHQAGLFFFANFFPLTGLI